MAGRGFGTTDATIMSVRLGPDCGLSKGTGTSALTISGWAGAGSLAGVFTLAAIMSRIAPALSVGRGVGRAATTVD